MNGYYAPLDYGHYDFVNDNQKNIRDGMINRNVMARYPSAKYDMNTKIYNEDDNIANDSRTWNAEGEIISQMPCQAVNNPTYMTFDTSKRNLSTSPQANNVTFYFPEIQNIHSIRLIDLQYPYFNSVVGDQYFNFKLDVLPVLNEAMATNNPSDPNNSSKVDNVTLQLPLIETTAGSGFCVWNWESEGQKPQRFTPRHSIKQIKLELINKNGLPVDTGVAPGQPGDPIRFVLEFVHKK